MLYWKTGIQMEKYVMKKYVETLLRIMIALGLSGCQNEASTPNACVSSVMYNGDIYCTTNKKATAR